MATRYANTVDVQALMREATRDPITYYIKYDLDGDDVDKWHALCFIRALNITISGNVPCREIIAAQKWGNKHRDEIDQRRYRID